MRFQYTGELKRFVNKAQSGRKEDVDYMMNCLTSESSLATTRYIDFALSLIEPNSIGFERIKFYLFNGSLIQRNYSSLYLNRLGEWKLVKEAFEKGLIDEIQAYSR